MPRRRRITPDHILSAAALEFAERGFAGARVDRIARRAHVNKAMLYYHFKSKQALYRALLRRTFSAAAERIQAIAASSGAAGDQLDRAVTVFTELIREQAFFPSIMLREVAEGGTHLDPETLAVLAGVPRAFGSIVAQGVAAGDGLDALGGETEYAPQQRTVERLLALEVVVQHRLVDVGAPGDAVDAGAGKAAFGELEGCGVEDLVRGDPTAARHIKLTG